MWKFEEEVLKFKQQTKTIRERLIRNYDGPLTQGLAPLSDYPIEFLDQTFTLLSEIELITIYRVSFYPDQNFKIEQLYSEDITKFHVLSIYWSEYEQNTMYIEMEKGFNIDFSNEIANYLKIDLSSIVQLKRSEIIASFCNFTLLGHMTPGTIVMIHTPLLVNCYGQIIYSDYKNLQFYVIYVPFIDYDLLEKDYEENKKIKESYSFFDDDTISNMFDPERIRSLGGVVKEQIVFINDICLKLYLWNKNRYFEGFNFKTFGLQSLKPLDKYQLNDDFSVFANTLNVLSDQIVNFQESYFRSIRKPIQKFRHIGDNFEIHLKSAKQMIKEIIKSNEYNFFINTTNNNICLLNRFKTLYRILCNNSFTTYSQFDEILFKYFDDEISQRKHNNILFHDAFHFLNYLKNEIRKYHLPSYEKYEELFLKVDKHLNDDSVNKEQLNYYILTSRPGDLLKNKKFKESYLVYSQNHKSKLDIETAMNIISKLPSYLKIQRFKSVKIPSDVVGYTVFDTNDGETILKILLYINEDKIEIKLEGKIPEITVIETNNYINKMKKIELIFNLSNENNTNLTKPIAHKIVQSTRSESVKLFLTTKFYNHDYVKQQKMKENKLLSFAEIQKEFNGYWKVYKSRVPLEEKDKINNKNFKIKYSDNEVIESMCYICPWAIDVIDNSTVLQLDCTFSCMAPYISCFPVIVKNNTTIPIGMVLDRTESSEIYSIFMESLKEVYYNVKKKHLDISKIAFMHDMGTSFKKFDTEYECNYFICLRHLIEKFGSNSRLAVITNRLANCGTIELYKKELDIALQEINIMLQKQKIKGSHIKRFVSYFQLNLDENNHIITENINYDFRMSLWNRSKYGVPTCTNHIERLHRALNNDTINQKSTLSRLQKSLERLYLTTKNYKKNNNKMINRLINDVKIHQEHYIRDNEEEAKMICEDSFCDKGEFIRNLIGCDKFPCIHVKFSKEDILYNYQAFNIQYNAFNFRPIIYECKYNDSFPNSPGRKSKLAKYYRKEAFYNSGSFLKEMIKDINIIYDLSLDTNQDLETLNQIYRSFINANNYLLVDENIVNGHFNEFIFQKSKRAIYQLFK